MRLRLGVPPGLNRDETAAVLDSALEAVTAANEPLIHAGRVPTFEQALRAGRVRWKPEPPGDEHFDLAGTVLARGWGDCDDLAPWHAASLRASGKDPGAIAVVHPSGPGRWHAVTQLSDGRTVDPSRAAGMGAVSGDDYMGPLWNAMFGDRLAMAVHPLHRGYAARVDVPEHDFPIPYTYSHLATGRQPHTAARAAIHGAIDLDRAAGEHQAILCGLHDLLCGVDPSYVDEALEAHGCVGFLPLLAPMAASLAAPLAKKAMGMFGGGGGGGGGGGRPAAAPTAAAAAPSMASRPGTTLAVPGGPIIVRF